MKRSLVSAWLNSAILPTLSLITISSPARAEITVLAVDGSSKSALIEWNTKDNDCQIRSFGSRTDWRNDKGKECKQPKTHLYTTDEVDNLLTAQNQRLDSGTQIDQQLGVQIEGLKNQLEQQNQKVARQDQIIQEQARLIAEQNRAFLSALDQIEERTLNSQSIKLVREQLLRELRSAK